MFDDLAEWVQAALREGYQYSRGMWIDHESLYDSFICAIQSMGGPGPDVDDRRPRYRILLVGPRNGRQHAPQLQQDIETLAQAALGDSVPCGAASLQALGEPVGPGYTTENRAWYSLDLEAIY